MVKPTDNDIFLKSGKRAEDIYENIKSTNDKIHSDIEGKWCYESLENVKNNINKIGYDKNKIKYVKGDVNDTLNKVIPDKISILRLDTDLYQSTKKEIEVLFPKVSKNGIIIIDDYYSWSGSKKAIDEYLKNKLDKIRIIEKEKTGGRFCFYKI